MNKNKLTVKKLGRGAPTRNPAPLLRAKETPANGRNGTTSLGGDAGKVAESYELSPPADGGPPAYAMTIKLGSNLMEVMVKAIEDGIIPYIKLGDSPNSRVIKVGEMEFKFMSIPEKKQDEASLCDCYMERKINGESVLSHVGRVERKLSVQQLLDQSQAAKWKQRSKQTDKATQGRRVKVVDMKAPVDVDGGDVRRGGTAAAFNATRKRKLLPTAPAGPSPSRPRLGPAAAAAAAPAPVRPSPVSRIPTTPPGQSGLGPRALKESIQTGSLPPHMKGSNPSRGGVAGVEGLRGSEKEKGASPVPGFGSPAGELTPPGGVARPPSSAPLRGADLRLCLFNLLKESPKGLKTVTIEQRLQMKKRQFDSVLQQMARFRAPGYWELDPSKVGDGLKTPSLHGSSPDSVVESPPLLAESPAVQAATPPEHPAEAASAPLAPEESPDVARGRLAAAPPAPAVKPRGRQADGLLGRSPGALRHGGGWPRGEYSGRPAPTNERTPPRSGINANATLASARPGTEAYRVMEESPHVRTAGAGGEGSGQGRGGGNAREVAGKGDEPGQGGRPHSNGHGGHHGHPKLSRSSSKKHRGDAEAARSQHQPQVQPSVGTGGASGEQRHESFKGAAAEGAGGKAGEESKEEKERGAGDSGSESGSDNSSDSGSDSDDSDSEGERSGGEKSEGESADSESESGSDSGSESSSDEEEEEDAEIDIDSNDEEGTGGAAGKVPKVKDGLEGKEGKESMEVLPRQDSRSGRKDKEKQKLEIRHGGEGVKGDRHPEVRDEGKEEKEEKEKEKHEGRHHEKDREGGRAEGKVHKLAKEGREGAGGGEKLAEKGARPRHRDREARGRDQRAGVLSPPLGSPQVEQPSEKESGTKDWEGGQEQDLDRGTASGGVIASDAALVATAAPPVAAAAAAVREAPVDLEGEAALASGIEGHAGERDAITTGGREGEVSTTSVGGGAKPMHGKGGAEECAPAADAVRTSSKLVSARSGQVADSGADKSARHGAVREDGGSSLLTVKKEEKKGKQEEGEGQGSLGKAAETTGLGSRKGGAHGGHVASLGKERAGSERGPEEEEADAEEKQAQAGQQEEKGVLPGADKEGEQRDEEKEEGEMEEGELLSSPEHEDPETGRVQTGTLKNGPDQEAPSASSRKPLAKGGAVGVARRKAAEASAAASAASTGPDPSSQEGVEGKHENGKGGAWQRPAPAEKASEKKAEAEAEADADGTSKKAAADRAEPRRAPPAEEGAAEQAAKQRHLEEAERGREFKKVLEKPGTLSKSDGLLLPGAKESVEGTCAGAGKQRDQGQRREGGADKKLRLGESSGHEEGTGLVGGSQKEALALKKEEDSGSDSAGGGSHGSGGSISGGAGGAGREQRLDAPKGTKSGAKGRGERSRAAVAAAASPEVIRESGREKKYAGGAPTGTKLSKTSPQAAATAAAAAAAAAADKLSPPGEKAPAASATSTPGMWKAAGEPDREKAAAASQKLPGAAAEKVDEGKGRAILPGTLAATATATATATKERPFGASAPLHEDKEKKTGGASSGSPDNADLGKDRRAQKRASPPGEPEREEAKRKRLGKGAGLPKEKSLNLPQGDGAGGGNKAGLKPPLPAAADKKPGSSKPEKSSKLPPIVAIPGLLVKKNLEANALGKSYEGTASASAPLPRAKGAQPAEDGKKGALREKEKEKEQGRHVSAQGKPNMPGSSPLVSAKNPSLPDQKDAERAQVAGRKSADPAPAQASRKHAAPEGGKTSTPGSDTRAQVGAQPASRAPQESPPLQGTGKTSSSPDADSPPAVAPPPHEGHKRTSMLPKASRGAAGAGTGAGAGNGGGPGAGEKEKESGARVARPGQTVERAGKASGGAQGGELARGTAAEARKGTRAGVGAGAEALPGGGAAESRAKEANEKSAEKDAHAPAANGTSSGQKRKSMSATAAPPTAAGAAAPTAAAAAGPLNWGSAGVAKKARALPPASQAQAQAKSEDFWAKYEKERPEPQGSISSYSQYKTCVAEFAEKHKAYKQLVFVIDSDRDDFEQLHEELLAAEKEKEPGKLSRVGHSIKERYKKCKTRVKRMRATFIVLSEELRVLKMRCQEYTKAHQKTS